MAKENFRGTVRKAMEEILREPKYSEGIQMARLVELVFVRIYGDTKKFVKSPEKNKTWANAHGLAYSIFSTQREKGAVYVYPKVGTKPSAGVATVSETRQEKEFYKAFAEFLQDENGLNECVKTEEVGSNRFGGKWGTPDVIGVFKPMGGPVQFNPEIVSAEIKVSKGEALVTGFGQACSYRLFSHKVYLVVPEPEKQNIPREYKRLESLCHIFGIGLVYFNPAKNPEDIKFNVIMRAQSHVPDMSYVNAVIPEDLVKKLLF